MLTSFSFRWIRRRQLSDGCLRPFRAAAEQVEAYRCHPSRRDNLDGCHFCTSNWKVWLGDRPLAMGTFYLLTSLLVLFDLMLTLSRTSTLPPSCKACLFWASSSFTTHQHTQTTWILKRSSRNLTSSVEPLHQPCRLQVLTSGDRHIPLYRRSCPCTHGHCVDQCVSFQRCPCGSATRRGLPLHCVLCSMGNLWQDCASTYTILYVQIVLGSGSNSTMHW